MNMEQAAARDRDRLPTPHGDAVAHLRHTLAAFADKPDDGMAVMATFGIYGDGVRTGLTWGDLRELVARLGEG